MKNRSYLVFWFSQMVSQLGSAMTAYLYAAASMDNNIAKETAALCLSDGIKKISEITNS